MVTSARTSTGSAPLGHGWCLAFSVFLLSYLQIRMVFSNHSTFDRALSVTLPCFAVIHKQERLSFVCFAAGHCSLTIVGICTSKLIRSWSMSTSCIASSVSWAFRQFYCRSIEPTAPAVSQGVSSSKIPSWRSYSSASFYFSRHIVYSGGSSRYFKPAKLL